MNQSITNRAADLRALIESFLSRRLNSKLEKLKSDDPKRQALRDEFARETWLADAANRVKQIQLVTHVLKATHPDPKIYQATSLYVQPETLATQSVLGSHVLGNNFRDDVTGSSAALDVFDFLTEEFQGNSLLRLIQAGDADLGSAMTSNESLAGSWMQAFASIDIPRCKQPRSHTLAKQLYWQTGDYPNDNASFHLLAPLYASSLAHRVFETLQDDRFSDAANAAREARKTNTFSERPVHEYPQLAVQQLGGTKPQNISQLNSERRGNNCLLASLPPVWRSVELKPLLSTESMFNRYSRRPEVRKSIKELLDFLKTDPRPNAPTRQKRATCVSLLIDEFLQFTAELRSLEPGWSQTSACQLGDAEARWLDP
ncbi:MAG: type I-F CRISPR-associated protein Csy1, partial [Burkholderiaceae bacterium]